MILKNLTRNELDQRMKTLVQKERDVLCDILLTIKEIDIRRSYLEFGFSSLFDYLTKSVGYSEGSAQRRIDAARFLNEVPKIAPQIQSGEINLSQVSMIQKAAREVIRIKSVQVSSEDKFELAQQILQMNRASSQIQVASFFDIPVRQETHLEMQSDESVRVELTLTKELQEKIKLAQELLSHSLQSSDLVQFLEFIADKVIKQKTSIRQKTEVLKRSNGNKVGPNMAVKEPAAVLKDAKKTNSKFTATVAVSRTVYKAILLKQKCCQFKDPYGNICGGKWNLQVDHIQPRWAGGGNEIENLQLLCAQHNRLKYRKEAGFDRG